MPLFDELFVDSQNSLDALFAESLEYRANGQVISIHGTLASHRMQLEADREIAESWHAEIVEVAATELTLDDTPFLPVAGHEIAKPLTAGGKDVHLVTNGPDGRPYAWIDTDHQRLIVYCKFIRTENT